MPNHDHPAPTQCAVSSRPLRIAISAALILALVIHLINFYKGYILNPEINDFEYQEFLINYQGGFVRRGLLGEILLKAIRILHFRGGGINL